MRALGGRNAPAGEEEGEGGVLRGDGRRRRDGAGHGEVGSKPGREARIYGPLEDFIPKLARLLLITMDLGGEGAGEGRRPGDRGVRGGGEWTEASVSGRLNVG
jgi:hypothetical protein